MIRRTTTLSVREQMILALAARGLTNEEIAQELRIRRSTVSNTFRMAYLRLNANNRGHAIAICLERNLIQHLM